MQRVRGVIAADFLQVETQFLLMDLTEDGKDGGSSTDTPCYGLLLPLIDGGRFRATLRPPRQAGDRSGRASHWQPLFAVASVLLPDIVS